MEATVIKTEKYEEYLYKDKYGILRDHVYPKTMTKETKLLYKADSKKELFSSFKVAKNRAYRSANGYVPRFRFEDETLNEEFIRYEKNLSKADSFSLYYRGGIVD